MCTNATGIIEVHKIHNVVTFEAHLVSGPLIKCGVMAMYVKFTRLGIEYNKFILTSKYSLISILFEYRVTGN